MSRAVGTKAFCSVRRVTQDQKRRKAREAREKEIEEMKARFECREAPLAISYQLLLVPSSKGQQPPSLAFSSVTLLAWQEAFKTKATLFRTSSAGKQCFERL